MHTQTLPPDGELILTRYLRNRLRNTKWQGALVSNRLTKRADGAEVPPSQDYAIVIRCDGNQETQPPVHRVRFGIRVIGPEGDDNGTKTGDLARHVALWLKSAWAHDKNIAHAPFVSGPTRVSATVGERQTNYITADLLMVSTITE